MLDLKTTAQSLTFAVYVQPRASRLGFAGCHQTALKIMLTAPPADGAANQQCIELLAKTLGVPKSAIDIVSGHTARTKRIRIQPNSASCTPDAIRQLTAKVLALASQSRG